MWPAGSQLIDALAEQNNQTFDKDEALTLVEYIFAQIFLDKLEMVKQKTTEGKDYFWSYIKIPSFDITTSEYSWFFLSCFFELSKLF